MRILKAYVRALYRQKRKVKFGLPGGVRDKVRKNAC
jgi:hypothetical protein